MCETEGCNVQKQTKKKEPKTRTSVKPNVFVLVEKQKLQSTGGHLQLYNIKELSQYTIMYYFKNILLYFDTFIGL